MNISSRTILDNLYINELTEDIEGELASLIAILNLESFVERLSHGLLTKLNSNTTNISGGEKQRLLLLRSLIGNPNIVIWDEPTSALGIHTRRKIYDYILEKKKNGVTFIIATHDMKIIKYADKVYRLDNKAVSLWEEYENENESFATSNRSE
ncbi:MAG: ATP-binding cassette domain-containing protein [Culicoidibacterales bacterium]